MGTMAEHVSPELLAFLDCTAALGEVSPSSAAAAAAPGAPGANGAAILDDDLDITSSQLSLEGVGAEIEAFADHEVLRAILDQGCDPKQYGRQYEAKLRQAELESIQDYITESDNLVELHEQVRDAEGVTQGYRGGGMLPD